MSLHEEVNYACGKDGKRTRFPLKGSGAPVVFCRRGSVASEERKKRSWTVSEEGGGKTKVCVTERTIGSLVPRSPTEAASFGVAGERRQEIWSGCNQEGRECPLILERICNARLPEWPQEKESALGGI